MDTNQLAASTSVVPEQALAGISLDFSHSRATDLLDRWNEHLFWWNERLQYGLDAYQRVTSGKIQTELTCKDRAGRTFTGVNFASQDYLNLSSHPVVIEAAQRAAAEFGVHSAGSGTLMGLSSKALELQHALCNFLGYAHVTVFPIGWAAGYGIVRTLVRPCDHIVIDRLAHACLQEGARAATRNVHAFEHISNDAVAAKLKAIRASTPDAGILVITETVFSMDSDVPDIASLQEICTRERATLLVDVAHDLGCIGEEGGGYLESQGMIGKVDLLMGSFSKTFASNGGFVASNHPALGQALRFTCGPLVFTNAMSPVQAATVLKCLEIIGSNEGKQLRAALLANIVRLRQGFIEQGFRLLGQPSAIVPVVLGDPAEARLMTKFALERGGLVNLVEYPAVPRSDNRWRCQVMARHTSDQIDAFVEIARAAREDTRNARMPAA